MVSVIPDERGIHHTEYGQVEGCCESLISFCDQRKDQLRLKSLRVNPFCPLSSKSARTLVVGLDLSRR